VGICEYRLNSNFQGIGKAVVDRILSTNSDAKVIVVARSEEKLNELVSVYGEDRVGVIVGDVTDPQTATNAVNLAIEKFDQINSVILNAGVLDPVGKIDQVDVDSWRKHFDVNFFSLVDLIQKSIGYLRKTNGSVIAVSSGASTSHYSGWYAYGCSKASVNHLIKALATEEDQISAISVAPGVVNTEMQQDIRDVFSKNMSPDVAKRFFDLHKNNELLPPLVPATVYANLALRGFSKELNGSYLRWNDELLASYTS
jgi:NAD(P)-dependent dehydrogenase (short-subunit alcohol dehydrogenase family)